MHGAFPTGFFSGMISCAVTTKEFTWSRRYFFRHNSASCSFSSSCKPASCLSLFTKP